MPLQEMQARFKIGNFEIGRKPGEFIEEVEASVLMYQSRDRHGVMYGQRARILSSEEVEVSNYVGESSVVVATLVGPEINRNRFLKRMVHWTEVRKRHGEAMLEGLRAAF